MCLLRNYTARLICSPVNARRRRTRVHEMRRPYAVPDLAGDHLQLHADVGVVQDRLEHLRVTAQGHALELVFPVTVVTHGDAGGNARVEL